MQVVILHTLGRSRADGSDPGASDFSQIVIQFEKNIEKSRYAIRACEDYPIVTVRVLHQLGKFAQVAGRLDPNCGQLKNIGPQSAQFFTQLASLFSRPCHHDSFS